MHIYYITYVIYYNTYILLMLYKLTLHIHCILYTTKNKTNLVSTICKRFCQSVLLQCRGHQVPIIMWEESGIWMTYL